MRLGLVTLLVPDYDEAIRFYSGTLGFELSEDTRLAGGKRWVVVTPGNGGAALLLAKAATPVQDAQIGKQAGGRVGYFLYSQDFPADYSRLQAAGVAFEEEPRCEAYGQVAVFRDPFGNRWDLLESSPER